MWPFKTQVMRVGASVYPFCLFDQRRRRDTFVVSPIISMMVVGVGSYFCPCRARSLVMGINQLCWSNFYSILGIDPLGPGEQR